MTLPKTYLTSTKNVGPIFQAIQAGQAPEKFTTRFLASLGFASAADRLVIALLKQLDFLDAEGKPKDRYFKYLDQTQGNLVLAEAVRETYADLFTLRRDAQNMSKQEVINKAKTLSQGTFSESVLDKFAATFLALCSIADFSREAWSTEQNSVSQNAENETTPPNAGIADKPETRLLGLGGIHYNIQIVLPASRDPKVFDALFRSLKEHLID